MRFGIFELDPANGELRRNGSLVRLAPQPVQVLRLLLEREGGLVGREEIRREVWGDTVVDFDRSLNVCIAQIRAALNDDAERPRFIQTVPRKGYRWLAPVERPAAASGVVAPPVKAARRSRSAAWLAGLAVIAIASAAYRISRPVDSVVRLAVMPFETSGLNPQEAAQIDGLFDELLTQLAGVAPDRLRVIGRRSVVRLGGERRTLKDIGQRLQVAYMTEGMARREGTQLSLAVRFAQSDHEGVLWSETFQQEGDARTFEETVVARVSAAVLRRLFPDAVPAAPEAACRDGWESYRAGRVLANAWSIGGLERSLGFFQAAPCAASRAALSEALVRLARISSRYSMNWEPARKAAQEALRLNSEMNSAHLALGNVEFWHDWNWTTAEREFQLAVRRNPSSADAQHDLAWLLVSEGRRSEALAALGRALALDPLSSRTNMDAAWLLLYAGRFREAAAQGRRTLEVDPAMKEAYSCAARALLYAGDYPAALAAMQPVMDDSDRAAVTGAAPYEALRRLMRHGLETMTEPYQRAVRLGWLGSREEALTQLEAAFRARSSSMPLVMVDPAFAEMRQDGRFRKIVAAMGL